MLCSQNVNAQVSFGHPALFNDGWLFTLNHDDSTYAQPRVDDSKWQRRTLPHDWSIEGQLSPTLASCTGYLPGGIGWYRKHFTVSSADMQDAAKAMKYIYFEGVYNRSEVYLNGHLLGKRPNGYASFMYDMTPYLKEGENVLAVRVDHSKYADSRWYTGSGIYRDVYFVTAPATHLAQWGTSWKATKITNASASVEVKVEVAQSQANDRSLSVKTEMYDASGKLVAKAQKAVGASSKKEGATLNSSPLTFNSSLLTLNLAIKSPHRWNLNDPYLYTLRTTLLAGADSIDGNETTVGIRTLEFTPDHGFSLNGKNTKVKGVCLHHDAGTLGAVVPAEVWERRLIKLKEIGVNAIRCAHNPQSPVLYDLCDRLGLMVMDEASDEWEFPKRKWVEGWNNGTPSYDGTFDFFEEWIDTDVADMVRRDRNHPSIILWSIGNEVDYPNDPYSHPVLDGGNAVINQPMFGGYDPKRPNAERIGKIAKRLSAIVRSHDDSRPVTGALAGVVMSNQTEYPEAVDVVGYNYTENRYDEDHKTYPKRVIYGSENGVGYDAWCAVRDKEFIFGQFIWTGTDYLGESGRWPSRGLNTGLLDFGSFAKPRGHFRASLWCDEPVCYIGTYPIRQQNGTRRQGGNNRGQVSAEALDTWNYNDGQTVRVVCYTNSPKARLVLNGKEVGEVKEKDPRNGIIYWDIPYEAGKLTAIGVSADGKDQATYDIHTNLRPASLRARFDDDNARGMQATEADTRTNALNHLLIEVLDDNGNVVRMADNNVTCRIEGPARLLGLEGSDNTDMGNYRDNQQRVHNGRLLAYIRNTQQRGTVRIILSSPLLGESTVEYEVR
ncbi:MAG: DUF4982 domain-containing protein [Bacteroidales bacterium]|nr:DUF4982 domain-containing protein [Bacteroidales bacterium]